MTTTAERKRDFHPIPAEQAKAAVKNRGIGGGDAAGIAGISPWSSPVTIWARKLGLIEPQPENREMRFGKMAEPMIATDFSQRHNVTLTRPDMMRHKEHNWMVGMIDRLIPGFDSALEIKTTSWADRRKWGEEGSDVIPDEYMLQVQHYLAITGHEIMWCAVLFRSSCEIRDYLINRNNDLIGEIIEMERAFWERHILTGIPPEPDGSEACRKALNARWKRDVSGKRQADLEETVLAGDLATAMREEKAATTRANELKNKLMARIGENAGLIGEAFEISWKAHERVTIDWQKVAETLAEKLADPTFAGDVKQAHMKAATVRPFVARFYDGKEEGHGD